MSEFEWLTLIMEILVPVRYGLALEFEETHQPARQPTGDSHGDDGGTGDQEEETGELGVNQVYWVILAAAAACNRWLKEDLGPVLRAGGQDFETPMTLDTATDIDYWARERAKPMMEEPADDDIERWLYWADLRIARTLPREEVDGIGALASPIQPSMQVSLVLASGCQSQNIIAAAGPDTFTCEDLLRLLASAVGGPSGWCIRLRSWTSALPGGSACCCGTGTTWCRSRPSTCWTTTGGSPWSSPVSPARGIRRRVAGR